VPPNKGFAPGQLYTGTLFQDGCQMSLDRRRFIQITGLLPCVSLLPACNTNSPPLSIGLQVWPGYEPMQLARSLGWINEAQINFVETHSATGSLELLEQGKIDAAGLTLDEVLRARERGVELTVILVCDISAGADVFLVRPGIPELAAIKGRRIGIEEGALGALMLHEVLKRAGLKRQDVTVVPVTIDEHVNAWAQKRVDAIATYEPSAAQIAKLGGQRLFDSRSLPDLIVDVVAVRSAVLDSHDDALRALVAAHLKGLAYIDTNPGDVAYRIAGRFKLPPDQALSVFRGLVLPDLDNNRRLLATQDPALKASVSAVSEAMLAAGILQRQPRTDKLFRADYLPASTQ
jgi:NitT/TauT family transport system substrate-binding protein